MANVDVNKPNIVFFKPTKSPTQMLKKLISPVRFPVNKFRFGIIWNDFRIFSIWVSQILISLAELKNSKIPGIQPKVCINPRHDES